MVYNIKRNILTTKLSRCNDYGKAAVLPSPVDGYRAPQSSSWITNAQYDVGMPLPLQKWRLIKVAKYRFATMTTFQVRY